MLTEVNPENQEKPKTMDAIAKDKKAYIRHKDNDEKYIKIKSTALITLRIKQLDTLLKKILKDRVPVEEQKLILFHNKRSDFPTLQWIKKQSKFPTDLENTCRLCVQPFQMKVDETRISLFPEPVADNFKTDFVELNRLNLKIYRDDGLPQYICADCASRLEQVHQFRIQAIRAQYVLQCCFQRIVSTNNLDDTIVPNQYSDDIPFEFLKVEPIEMFDSIVGSKDKIIDLSDVEMVTSFNDLEYKCNDCESTFPEYKMLLDHREICKKPKPQPVLESNLSEPNVIIEEEELNDDNSASYEINSIQLTESALSAFIEKSKRENSLKRRPLTPTTNYKFSRYCGICHKSFTSLDARKNHMLIHNEGNHQCLKCDRNFELKFELTDHYNQVHPSPIICSNCGRSFRTKQHLSLHLKWHVQAGRRRQFNCQYCDKTFKQVHHLRYHENIHTGARPFLCNTCGKSFKSDGCLSSHRRNCDKSHSKYKQHLCEYCNKRFSLKETLDIHIRSHTGERPFVCDLCDKRFPSKNVVKIHIELVHINNYKTKNKNYKTVCKICNMRFRSPKSLIRHMKRGHVGEEERKFVCDICKQRYKQLAHLRIHINGVHLNVRNYKCDKCERAFHCRGNLNDHLMYTHKEELVGCLYCGKKFREIALRAHMSIHTDGIPYQGDICNTRFKFYSADRRREKARWQRKQLSITD